MPRRLVLFGLVVLALNSSAARSAAPWDASLEKAKQARAAGNKAEALKWFQKAADEGSEDGEWQTAGIYSSGDGVPKDPKEAIRWYQKVVDRKGALAEMASMSIKLEAAQAGSARQAAETDKAMADAQKASAASGAATDALMLFMDGDTAESKKDYAAAMTAYKQAAAQHSTMAAVAVGNLHEHGLGVPKDTVEAAKWYKKAADAGDAAGERRLKALAEKK